MLCLPNAIGSTVSVSYTHLSIRILLVDDHNVVLDGLRMFLGLDPELEIVGQAADGTEAVKLAHALRPDVVLMDLLMPVMDGITATGLIRRQLPEVEVVALTSVLEDEKVIGAIRALSLIHILSHPSAPAAWGLCHRGSASTPRRCRPGARECLPLRGARAQARHRA